MKIVEIEFDCKVERKKMKYLIIILVICGILIFALQFKYKFSIKWRTFYKKGFRPKLDNFGIYTYDGTMGCGKSFSLVEYLYDNYDHINIFSNIILYNMDYEHITGFNGLLDIKERLDKNLINSNNKQIVIVFDELFSELQKGSKLSKEIISFLAQLRKNKIILLTSAQFWAEIPLSFRRFVRYEIKCKIIRTPFFGILIKRFGDAEQMKWDENEQDFVCPIVNTTVTKCRKIITTFYNTYQRISSVEVPTPQTENIDDEFWEDIESEDFVLWKK